MKGAPKKRKDVLQRDLEDGCVLRDPGTGQVYTLNVSAALVWELCDGAHTLEDMAKELASTTGGKPSEVLGDVERIVKDFGENNLLQSAR